MNDTKPSVLRRILGVCAIVLGIASGAAGPSAASQDTSASPWDETPYGRARLVAGAASSDPGAPLIVGVEIDLKPGWKTYWRVPGEAGVPPLFDFSGSLNLKQATVQWPVPRRYRDQYGETIGYKNNVVFPVALMPADAGKPVVARLELAYATCREICVPIQSRLSLEVSRSSLRRSPHATAVASNQALVPDIGGPQKSGPVRSIRVVGTKENARLLIELEDDAITAPAEIFVEGPEEYYFGAPTAETPKPGAGRRFAVPVDGLRDAAALSGKKLTLTIVAGDKRLQQGWVME